MFVWFEWYIAFAWLIRLGMIPVILRRQLAPGASVAWLGIIFLHPYIGLLLYAILGETRLGPHRAERHREIVAAFRSAARDDNVDLDLPLRYEPMVRQAERISGLPVLGGNSVELLGPTPEFIDRLVADIDAATQSVHLLYYIYALDDTGRRVADAVKRAASRGVQCRMLIDAVASRRFFYPHRGWARDLQSAGIHVAAALPAHVIQRRVPRMDLRNHRKLAVIDSRVAYAGSHNITDPDYGGRRGAPWVDATGRFTGPVVSEFAGVFAEDWAFETGQMLDVPIATAGDGANPGTTPIQLVPTGPTDPNATYRRVLLAAIQCAHRTLTLTTPYFVPDEPTIVALMMAADRGVDVKLILPALSDNRFAAMAGRAHFARLMAAGVSIHLYRPGLLHAKSAAVDDALALFGSANIDVRSFNLNFELSILLYGREATDRLKSLQSRFLADSAQLDPADWTRRPALLRYADSAASLLSPVL